MTSRSRLYLDHAATSPILPEARDAMVAAMDRWANPSSVHGEGRAARAELERCRASIADALGWRHDVILTSGATEAIAIAAVRGRAGRRAMVATEHDAVAGAMAGMEPTVIPVDENGLIDLDGLDSALSDGAALVAVQQVNNETGVVQPLGEVAGRVRAAGALLLADCAQGAGKRDLPDADFISISAHKLGGPPGIGALLVRDRSTLSASGGQERGYRRGTENVPAAAGFAAALESGAFKAAMPAMERLRDRLERAILADGGSVIAARAERSAAIGAYAMPRTSSASQLVQFDLAGIAVSAGSACSSGSMKASHVLAAMGLSQEIAGTVVRVSFGPTTSEADVDRFVDQWRAIRARGAAEAA